MRQLWELDVGGSNPSTPTKDSSKLRDSATPKPNPAGTDAGTVRAEASTRARTGRCVVCLSPDCEDPNCDAWASWPEEPQRRASRTWSLRTAFNRLRARLHDWLSPLALLALLTACAEAHPAEVEQPPFYVHFAADVSPEDRDLWGAAAAELNVPAFAATGEYLFFVASGPARGVCGVEIRQGTDLAIEPGGCLTVITYAPDDLDVDAARQALTLLAGGDP